VLCLALSAPACDGGGSSDGAPVEGSTGETEGAGTEGATEAATEASDEASGEAPATAPTAQPTSVPAQGAIPSDAFAALGRFVLQARDALTSAATGGAVDPRWQEVGGAGDGLNTTQADVIAQVTAFGAPEHVVTVLELEAIGTDSTGRNHRIRALAGVLPSGEVKLAEIGYRTLEIPSSATAGLDSAAPELHAAVVHLIALVSQDPCDVPVFQPADVSHLPEEAREELLEAQREIGGVCAQVARLDVRWEPRIDDITVVYESGGRYAGLRSSFEVNDGHLSLSRVRFREMN